MLIVSKDKFTLSKDRRGLISEASDLGLAPGEWPDMISVVEDPEADSTDGFLFFRGKMITHGEGSDREFGGYEYATKRGHIFLTIFND